MSAEARAGRGHPSCRRLTKRSRIWNRRIIAELSKDVSDAQQSLHLNTTVLIKAKLDKHTMRLEEAVMLLDVPRRDLLLSFLANFGQLNAKCDDIQTNQHRSEELAAMRHLEVITCLETIRSESPLSVVST
jgi:hypothetical protein